MSIMTGLSGNEMYCLHLKGLSPGELVIGNSVYSLGFVGGIGAGLKSAFGGEVTQITKIIHEGRQQSYARMLEEAQQRGGAGITGVTSELRAFHGNIEFLSVASCVHAAGQQTEKVLFSTSGDGQELYCLLDAGYSPRQFVFGNVAYSTGIGGGLLGGLKSLARGEIKEFSDIFNTTRHLALARIAAEARAVGANAVVGIETEIMPFQGVHEMIMMGTAAHNPALDARHAKEPVTSDLTCEEMWNLTNMGYMPLKLVLGTAVYSLGFFGGLKAMFKSFSRGEISDLTFADLRRPRARHRSDQAGGGGDRRRRRGGRQDAHPRVGRPDRVHGHRHRRETRARHRHRHAHPAAAGDHQGQGHVDQPRRQPVRRHQSR